MRLLTDLEPLRGPIPYRPDLVSEVEAAGLTGRRR